MPATGIGTQNVEEVRKLRHADTLVSFDVPGSFPGFLSTASTATAQLGVILGQREPVG